MPRSSSPDLFIITLKDESQTELIDNYCLTHCKRHQDKNLKVTCLPTKEEIHLEYLQLKQTLKLKTEIHI